MGTQIFQRLLNLQWELLLDQSFIRYHTFWIFFRWLKWALRKLKLIIMMMLICFVFSMKENAGFPLFVPLPTGVVLLSQFREGLALLWLGSLLCGKNIVIFCCKKFFMSFGMLFLVVVLFHHVVLPKNIIFEESTKLPFVGVCCKCLI